MDLNDLLLFLERERYSETHALFENYHKESAERAENHLCVEDCEIIEVTPSQLKLLCPKNQTRFREGDMVRVGPRGQKGKELAGGFEMEWISYNAEQEIITLDRSYKNRTKNLPFRIGAKVDVDSASNDLHDALKQHLMFLRSSPMGEKVEEFLSGKTRIQAADVDEKARQLIFSALTFNPAQKDAFDNVISKYPVAGIQGPPGTGKTWVLAAVAVYYLSRGFDVRVSAVSHFAINHALNQICKLMKTCGINARTVKVSKSRNTSLLREVVRTGHVKDLPEDIPTAWGMTPWKFRFEIARGRQRILLMDEASQAPLTLASLALAFHQKVIFFGDHRQMRPIAQGKNHPPDVSRSVFEHLVHFFPGHVRMLTESYRMNTQLLKTPSKLYYADKLHASETAAQRKLRIKPVSDPQLAAILDCDKPGIWCRLSHRACTKTSEHEAALCALIVRAAVCEGGISPDEIAVLVPFRAQQMLIRKALSSAASDGKHLLGAVVVDTVERMQGQERDLILFSACASDPQKLSSIAESFFEPNKINVAMTRARCKRIIIASQHLLETRTRQIQTFKAVSSFAEFLNAEFCIDISSKYLNAEAQRMGL